MQPGDLPPVLWPGVTSSVTPTPAPCRDWRRRGLRLGRVSVDNPGEVFSRGLGPPTHLGSADQLQTPRPGRERTREPGAPASCSRDASGPVPGRGLEAGAARGCLGRAFPDGRGRTWQMSGPSQQWKPAGSLNRTPRGLGSVNFPEQTLTRAHCGLWGGGHGDRMDLGEWPSHLPLPGWESQVSRGMGRHCQSLALPPPLLP